MATLERLGRREVFDPETGEFLYWQHGFNLRSGGFVKLIKVPEDLADDPHLLNTFLAEAAKRLDEGGYDVQQRAGA